MRHVACRAHFCRRACVAASPPTPKSALFIIANNADGYGVDRCLASGATCGAAAATAYCRSREFSQAASYRKVDRDDITGAVPAGSQQPAEARNCDEFVAIECSR